MLPRGPPFSGYETAQDFRRSLKRRNETERGSKALSPDSRRSARPFRVDAPSGHTAVRSGGVPASPSEGRIRHRSLPDAPGGPRRGDSPLARGCQCRHGRHGHRPRDIPCSGRTPAVRRKEGPHASSGNPRPDFTHRCRSGASAYRTHTEKTTHRPPAETATIPPSTGQTVRRGKGMSSVCRFGSMPCNAAFQPSLQQAGKFLLFRSPLASSALALLDHLKLPVRPHRRLSPSGGGPVA